MVLGGRENHDRVNPYYRGSAGGHRLEMKAFDPALNCEVALEYSNGQVRQRRELVFVESSGGNRHRLPIPDDLRDPETLRAMYARLGVTNLPSAGWSTTRKRIAGSSHF